MTEDVPRRIPGSLAVETFTRQLPPDSRPRPALLARDLEDLRDRVLHKLDSIEGLARSRAGAASDEISRLEQALKQRIEELEAERSRERSSSGQDESNWRQLLGQLEDDRQL